MNQAILLFALFLGANGTGFRELDAVAQQMSSVEKPCEALLTRVDKARQEFAHDEQDANQKSKALQIELNEATRNALSPIGMSILQQAQVPSKKESAAALTALAAQPFGPGITLWEGEWQKQVARFTRALGRLEAPAFKDQLAKGGFVDLGDFKLGTFGYLQIRSGVAGYARARMEALAQSLNLYCDGQKVPPTQPAQPPANPETPAVDSAPPAPPAPESGAAD